MPGIGYALVGALAGYAILRSSDSATNSNQTQKPKDPFQQFSDWLNPGGQPAVGNGPSNQQNNIGAQLGSFLGNVLGSHFWEGGDKVGSNTGNQQSAPDESSDTPSGGFMWL